MHSQSNSCLLIIQQLLIKINAIQYKQTKLKQYYCVFQKVFLGIDAFCADNTNFDSVLIILILPIIVKFLFFQLLNIWVSFKILLSQLICIHTSLLCPTLMSSQLTLSITFTPVICFRSLHLHRPIVSDLSKLRSVPACLLKVFMFCSANFRLSFFC